MKTYPDALSPAAVAVLDRLPDGTQFTAGDAFDALTAARKDGIDGAASADVGAVLDLLLAEEIVTRAPGGRYVVVPDARPL